MCVGNLFGGGSKPSPVYIPPPPAPDPGLAAKETQIREQGLQNQQEATKARKKQISEGLGRRSLLTSSGGGYLSYTSGGNTLG